MAVKKILMLFLAASPCLFAQNQTSAPIRVSVWGGAAMAGSTAVQGAPFSATINTKSVQTLTDSNQIVQTSTGSIARDSQGRTRQELPPPSVGPGGLKVPRLALIQDPVSRTVYSLDLSDKTAQEMPLPSSAQNGDAHPGPESAGFAVEIGPGGFGPSARPMLDAALFGPKAAIAADHQNQVSTEDLGSQTMEGLLVNGTRTTTTIPAGQIGNSEPITIVHEVWTSPDLKTVIYSKRSDPLTGDETFQLTNIVRTEPDPSLFAVPADFKIVEGPAAIADHPNQ